jgi:integrase
LRAAATPEELEPTPLVFCTPRGGQFWNATWSYYWHQIRAAAGRPGMDFYELRHYCATRLLEAGLDYPDVAVQLGHTDGGDLVRKVYGHPSQRKALDRVRAALNQEDQANVPCSR